MISIRDVSAAKVFVLHPENDGFLKGRRHLKRPPSWPLFVALGILALTFLVGGRDLSDRLILLSRGVATQARVISCAPVAGEPHADIQYLADELRTARARAIRCMEIPGRL